MGEGDEADGWEGHEVVVCRRRTTEVHFECGETDFVESVRETEMCNYVIKFSTVAACIEDKT